MKKVLNIRSGGLAILTCLLFFFPAWSWAAVCYVDIANGTDDGSHGGSPGTGAWKTLHYAVSQIVGGDVLNVAAGVYNISHGEDNAELIISQSGVTIQGAPGGASILEGPGICDTAWENGIEVAGSNVVIRNLAVKGFQCEYAGIYFRSGTDTNTIESCEIFDNEYGIYVDNSSPKIRKNRIYDHYTGIYIEAEAFAEASPTISNNLIYGTGATVGASTMETGIDIGGYDGTSSPFIYHNTIDWIESDGIFVNMGGVGNASPEIKYNIITNYGLNGINNNVGTPVIAYNDVWTGTAGSEYNNCSGGTGALNVDPLYASYQLQPASQCIDAIPSSETDPVGDDIDGNSRPQGAGYDMGAYEQAISIVEVVPIPPGEEIPEYIMVSFTVEPEDPSCNSVFSDDMGGAYDPENFRIGGYDATMGTGGYRECDTGLTIEPGHAYWMLARDGLKATVDGIPTSMNDTEVPLLYSAATGNGWNQIGPPNHATYLWEDVEVVQYGAGGAIVNGPTCIFDLPSDNPMIDKRLWRWDGGSYLDNTSTLVQGEGYWVRARASNVSLIFLQSVQLAQISNTDIMFADLWNRAKRWAKQWVFGPQAAIADSGDTPPMPMEGIATPASEEGGGGGCLIDTMAAGILGH